MLRNAKRDNTLLIVETSNSVLLTPYDPELVRQIQAGLGFMSRYRKTFRTLAN
jgi:hypothetical protein